MKAVLRLMALNFWDDERRSLLWIWLFFLAVAISLQLWPLAEVPKARLGMFYVEMLILWPFFVPQTVQRGRVPVIRVWWLLPWGRLRLITATALVSLGLSCVGSLLYAIAATAARTGIADFLREAALAFPTLFTPLSLSGVTLFAQSAAVTWRWLNMAVVAVCVSMMFIYGMEHELLRVTHATAGRYVWLAFAVSIAFWLVGGWWYAFKSRPAEPSSVGIAEFLSNWRASRLMRRDATSALLRANWKSWIRWPSLLIWMAVALVMLARMPAEAWGSLLYTASVLAAVFGMRALFIAQSSSSQSRALWLVSGDRSAVLRICEGVLFKEVATIGTASFLLLATASWLLGRAPETREMIYALLISLSLPLCYMYVGLISAAAPDSTKSIWWFGLITAAIGANAALPVQGALRGPLDNGLIAGQAMVLTALLPLLAGITRRLWRNVDWSFRPTQRQGFLPGARS